MRAVINAFANQAASRKTFIFSLQKSIKHLSLLVAFRQTVVPKRPEANHENVSAKW